MTFAFENPLVYQKAVGFADAICSLTRGFPRGYFFLADQLKANLEEIARMLSGLINGLDSRDR